MKTDRFIGYDLDGVIRHNNKSLGTGDIRPEQRNNEELRRLSKSHLLPTGYYITSPEHVQFIDGALETLALMKELDIPQYVMSNQEAIGIGAMTWEDWDLVRDWMNIEIQKAGGCIDNWFWCPHAPDAGCECRKPRTGMFRQLEKQGGDLSKMLFIGDNPSDMQAAHDAGCGYKIHIILEGADKEFQKSDLADATASSLKGAVCDILRWLYYLE